jgi:DNA-binding cell septation regulator SpoVG
MNFLYISEQINNALKKLPKGDDISIGGVDVFVNAYCPHTLENGTIVHGLMIVDGKPVLLVDTSNKKVEGKQ